MLVEKLVQETLGIKDHRVVLVEGDRCGLKVYLERIRRHRLPCSCCGERSKVRDRRPERCWMHVPFWGIPVTLHYRPTRVICSKCGLQMEKIPWSVGKSRLSLPLITVLATWSRLLAWKTVAEMVGLAWGTVRSAVESAVQYGLEHRDTSEVLYLGIDEISVKKGHRYVTQVYDLAQKRLLWSGEGRKEETLDRFFTEWGPERCARIRGLCCDMWKPYMKQIQAHCPVAVMVFDKFHLIRHLLQAVDEVRKQEAFELRKKDPDVLKGTKYIWLKNPWNLTPRQKERFGYLARLNLKVNKAYIFKEAFRQLWDYKSVGQAAAYLNKLIWWATHSRIQPLVRFGKLLRAHQEGILAWFRIPLNNGATEAMNNNAKQISHRCHGFRTTTTYINNLYHCLGKMPVPQTTHRFL